MKTKTGCTEICCISFSTTLVNPRSALGLRFLELLCCALPKAASWLSAVSDNMRFATRDRNNLLDAGLDGCKGWQDMAQCVLPIKYT